ncbi:uncharacterized protein LOC116134077 [Pistacia vera]|uniref:uncharacterized protein LOC116134077 n=1 Tax=Pistacia vera TaxID=55513 RepID=UPI001263BDDC|nr:uncharacterized protein LOC116134077 [Pistacia vera]
MSVLDDHEVLFPMVQVGNHRSKWITVKNPSQHPVVMQLILNSGEIIDECRGTDGLIQPPSSGSLEFTRPTRYGFSIAENAVTEAFVHPHGRASFGPILFNPSDRCTWRSSALIRNNLSGVEWLSLRGLGGSLSLVLFEGSESIESVEFSVDLPVTQNLTPDMLFQVEDTTSACSKPLSKELYVKNTGDLPLEVRSIGVSGTECGLDGFMVHTCTGFLLEPGESTKLLISYQTDFSAAMVHRDLELTLATGILVIPMKANLPVLMLNVCKKSVFWRLRKFSIAIIFAACIITSVLYFLYLLMTAPGSEDCIYKDEKNSINTTRSAGKSSRVHRNQRNIKSSVPDEMDCLLSSIGKGKMSKQASVDGYRDSQNEPQEQDMNAQPSEPTLENHRHTNGFSDTLSERGLPSVPSKPAVVEDSDTVEASQTDNLTVRTGKEKGRRRRKRKGACTVLTGLLEVSSSQSGNSTPSSPLSPITSFTSTRTWVPSPDLDQSTESRNSFTQMADQHCEKVQVPELVSQAKILKPQLSQAKVLEPQLSQAKVLEPQPSQAKELGLQLSQAKVLEPQFSQAKVLEPQLSQAKVLEPQLPGRYRGNNCYISNSEQSPGQRRIASKPVLLPSATFPCAGKAVRSALCSTSPLASTSTIAPHARAPGSKICNQKTFKGEPAGFRDEYTYDIWGDHFSRLGLVGRSKDVTAVNSSAMVNYSDSFFVSGPQALRTNSQSRSVSCSNQDG